MAVLGRVLFSSAERVDLSDLTSIDSYSAGDWRYFVKSLVGDTKPYILYGFDVIDPENAIGTQNCSIRVADSVAYYPGSSAGPFYYGLPEGNVHSIPLVPELRKNAVNYVYVTLSTLNTSLDTRAFWDPDRNGGEGGEFTQDINTESMIVAQVGVSTGSFPSNTIPIAKITVGAVVITAIEDARNLMFRLGSGGVSPDPYSTYNFRSLPTSSYQREETPTLMTSASDPNPFQGADKNIKTLKEWMDVVMTKLKELGGTTFWYQDTSTFSMTSIFHDALATTFKSKGQYIYASSDPGQLTWTEDVLVKSVNDPRDIIIRAGNKTLGNEQVAYLDLVRNQPANIYDEQVAWINGQNYVNTIGGSIGFFANLSKGDWVKKSSDGAHLYLQVQEFYDTVNLGGSITTAANARSIRLSGTYQGLTSNDRITYSKGVYQASDILVQDRSNAAITAAGGNFMWLAQRSDTVQGISSISSVSLSGSVATADGSVARINCSSHGLSDGDRITVTAPLAQAGTYSVDVYDSNVFYITTSNTTTGAFTGFYGLATTTTRNNGYGLQLESAPHGFDSGENIYITGTANYDDDYIINVRSSTQIQFPLSAAYASESSGNATLARLDVRTEKGVTKIVQGETLNIGETDSNNIRLFIGMNSMAEVNPLYFIPASYGTIGLNANYNSSASDDLTTRASRLTAMTANKAQDKTVKYLCDAVSATNATDGVNPLLQNLTFNPSGSTLTILQPSSVGNAVISLPASPGIQLAADQSAYVQIDRNAASAPSIVVANNSSIPLGENVFIIASRLSSSAVFLWNGEAINGTVFLSPPDGALYKVKHHDIASVTLPTGNPVTIDGSTVNADDLVLFTNLSSGSDQIYKANGSGTNITSWTVQYTFNGSAAPADGDTVIVLSGTKFADQVGKYTGTAWVFNDYVRYFNGADYWEIGSLNTTTLLDNTIDNVFIASATGNENLIIDYSLVRDTAKETGTIYITSDGVSSATASTAGVYLNTSGVSFSADISGSDVRLRYTTTSTGNNATMKYYIKRWAD